MRACVRFMVLAVAQMLGMNAAALHHVVNGMFMFFERIGFAAGELVSFITAQPQPDANGAYLVLSA